MKLFWMMFGVMLLMWPAWSRAQVDDVVMRVDVNEVGMGGRYRPGAWMSAKVRLENRSSRARQVVVEAAVADSDQDVVQYRRLVTLNPGPGNEQQVWMYVQLPMRLPMEAKIEWRLLDGADEGAGRGSMWDMGQQMAGAISKTQAGYGVRSQVGRVGKVLEQQVVGLRPEGRVVVENRMVGILGSGAARLGLGPYEEGLTQQEPTVFVNGLTVGDLPDRWYGMSSLSALIWVPGGGDPMQAKMSAGARQALRQWVRRGGHLVIVLGSEGEYWTGSELKDLLPVSREQIRRVEDCSVLDLPPWLGQPMAEVGNRMSMHWFDVEGALRVPHKDGQGGVSAVGRGLSRTGVLLRDGKLRPVVVAGGYGMGRVTVIGIDLTAKMLGTLSLPKAYTLDVNPVGRLLWPSIFSWRGPVFTREYISSERIDQLSRIRSAVELDSFIVFGLSMRQSVGWLILIVLFVFSVYWLLAGPVSYAFLKKKGQVKQAWVVFGLLVLVFSVVVWVAAIWIKPARLRASHFSIVDIDLESGLARGHSWWSLFVPVHRLVEVGLVGNEKAGSGDYLGSPGVTSQRGIGGFLDPQKYAIDAADPVQAVIPWRSTVKMMEADYLLSCGQMPQMGGLNAWPLPEAKVQVVGGKLVGTLKHQLPGELKDVLMVFSPGGWNRPVWVWRVSRWRPGEEIHLASAKIMSIGQELILAPVDPESKDKPSLRQWRGHLGDLTRSNSLQDVVTANPQRRTSAMNSVQDSDSIETAGQIQLMELLSFYDAMPSPDYSEASKFSGDTRVYQRSIARVMDMSGQLGLPRLLVLGHLRQVPGATAGDSASGAEKSLAGTNVSGGPLGILVDGQKVDAWGWTMVRMMVPVQ